MFVNTLNTVSGRLKFSLSALCLIAGVIDLSSCVAARTQMTQVAVPPQVTTSAVRFKKEYILVAGDTIEIAVRRAPEVSRTVVIRGDGFVSLPILQDVQAGGLTTTELRDRLTEKFASRLVDPEVSIIPVQVRQPMVYVTGDVGNSSVAVPFREAPTAMQAITLGGGFRRTSAVKDVAIIRLSEDGFLRVIDVKTDASGQPGPYVALRTALLQPDDVIFVPESGRSQFQRFLNDFLLQPLTSVNSLLGTYTNFRLVQIFNRIY